MTAKRETRKAHRRGYQDVVCICQTCDKEFEGRRDAKFCSPKCRQQAYRDSKFAAKHELSENYVKHMTPEQKSATSRASEQEQAFCEHCHRPYWTDATHTNRIYCSPTCKQAAYRERHRYEKPISPRDLIIEGRKVVVKHHGHAQWAAQILRFQLNPHTGKYAWEPVAMTYHRQRPALMRQVRDLIAQKKA